MAEPLRDHGRGFGMGKGKIGNGEGLNRTAGEGWKKALYRIPSLYFATEPLHISMLQTGDETYLW